MNLGDPELELIDPTPNVHSLFIQFDKTFFWAKLASRAVVRWSKRMYSCAGICSYEGRGGLCDIALSEPLLKLRPRKDLIETLLHEMIHAYLFITQRVQDRDGHGPNFQEHMFRINRAAGINISIYHDFHDEVELYQIHWWRCDGPCQFTKPHYGIVRRSTNTAPGPRDYWWASHQRKCGGTFIKFKEPEKKKKKAAVVKPQGDITKYITNSKIPPMGEPKIMQISDINSGKSKSVQTKSNNSSTVVVTQKGVSVPTNVPTVKPPSVVTGKGYTLAGTRVRSNSVDASEAVRNVWAKKQLTPNTGSPITNANGKNNTSEVVRNIWAKKQLIPKVVSPIADVKAKNDKYYILKPSITNVTPNKTQAFTNANDSNMFQKATKHKANSVHTDSPPLKVKKIDDYFKTNAATLLKDIYGTDIKVVESNNNKLIAVNNATTSNLQVECPICGIKIEESNINTHIDECLNKDLIKEICNTNETDASTLEGNDNNQFKLPPIPPFKPKMDPGSFDSTMNMNFDTPVSTFNGTFHKGIKHCDKINWNENLKPHMPKTEFDPADLDKAKSVVNNVHVKHIRKSDSFVIKKEKKDLGSGGHLPSFAAEDVKVKIEPPVKTEPGTSVSSVLTKQKCPCCGNKMTKPIDEHLDECLAFFATDTAPEEASTSFANHAIVIDDDDDDIFDESQVFNATGTKLPCPCCLEMVENDDMNAHLDSCLS